MSVTWNERVDSKPPSSEEEFATAAAPLLERLRTPVLRALRDSGIPVDSLAEIVLVGGATRMPIVRKTVTKMFGRFPGAVVNPDEAVALGAAVQAGLKARDSALREVVLTDVCPYTLGVDTSERLANGGIRENLFAPIIERNTVIPASRERTFSPLDDRQRKVAFSVFQGESPNCLDNIRLGIDRGAGAAGTRLGNRHHLPFHLRHQWPARSRGLRAADRRATPARDLGQRSAVGREDVEHAPRSARQVSRFIRAIRRSIVRSWPARIDATKKRSASAARNWARRLSQFQSTVDGQDPRAIEAAREEFTRALDAIEGETFL